MSGICGIVNIGKKDRAEETLLSSMAGSMLSADGGDPMAAADRYAGLGVNAPSVGDHIINDNDIVAVAVGEAYDGAAGPIAGKVAGLYRKYREKCAEYLDGQFNFCIWDKREEKLVLATDRFGTSALNYYYDGKHFIFASKIRALLKASIFKPSIDNNAIYNYCTFTFVPTPQTIYNEVKKIPPGHAVILHNGEFDLHKYWDISYADGGDKGEKYYRGRIMQELEYAVKRRFDPLKDGDRTGAFLSGGLDSSTVCGLMTKIGGRDVKTFSIGFREKRYDETEYADIAARHFGLKNHKHIVEPGELIGAIKTLVKEYDEPFGNQSAIAAYYCMKMARDNGVDILLGGDGGDENFGGYDHYVLDKVYSIYQHFPVMLRRSLIEPFFFNKMLESVRAFRRFRSYIKLSNLPDPERRFFYELYPVYDRGGIFSSDFLKTVDSDAPLELMNAYYSSPRTKYHLNRLMYLDAKIGLIDNDLRGKIDRASQVAGVSVRFPMLDNRLWELGSAIPSGLKVKGFARKYIFKEALKCFLPKEIIAKKKQGFGVPYAVWLRNDPGTRKFTEEMLLDPSAITRRYFKKDFFDKMLRLHDTKTGMSYYGDILWRFLMLEAWHREWACK